MNRRPRRRRRSASALILILMCVALVTLLSLSFFLFSRIERSTSTQALAKAKSDVLADIAADAAIARLKEATEAGMAEGKMWISEPGRIRVYECLDLNSARNYNLFSALPGVDTSVKDQNNVDLNRRSLNGRHAITGTVPGTMKIGWVNLSANPGQAFSADNPVVGRVAYWVDDESCKVNINTADGSKKEDLYRQLEPTEFSESFGFGTPGEISLQALKDSKGVELTPELAAAISQYAWDKGFNTAAEIGRIPNLPADFYQANQFNITHYSKIPEICFNGEPRMYTMPVLKATQVKSAMVGPYYNYNSGSTGSGTIDFVYPTNNQFTPALLQFPMVFSGQTNNDCLADADNKAFLVRMGRAINGFHADGVTKFQWPAFNGETGGFSKKYSLRQIDSLVLQIFDLCNTNAFPDSFRTSNIPSIAPSGIINDDPDPEKSKIVIGLSRYLKLTEIFLQTTVSAGTKKLPDTTSVPVELFQMRVDIEANMPKGFAGCPLSPPYATANTQWSMTNSQGGSSSFSCLNQTDMQRNTPPYSSASYFGNFWHDKLFKITDQSGAHAGIDITGNPAQYQISVKDEDGNSKLEIGTNLDPDQSKAAAYHPWNKTPAGTYQGSGPSGGRNVPVFEILGVQANGPVVPGQYMTACSRYKGSSILPTKPGVSSLKFNGGVTFWNRTGINMGGWVLWEPVPLDSIRGPFTGEAMAKVESFLEQAVIPVKFSVGGVGAVDFQMRVKDPLVNKFPGDWEQVTDPPMTDVTMVFNNVGNSGLRNYKRGGYASVDPSFTLPAGYNTSSSLDYFINDKEGDNPGSRPDKGGDLLSIWLPRLDIRYPKQSRFPSVGAFNYIRTGMIPDDLDVQLKDQKGTPWRCLNFSASTSESQAVHGVKYPDWAMLDLFTVPYLPQKPYRGDKSEPATPLRKLTWGGATEGKLNINNPEIPYPFGENPAINTAPPKRTAPLEALFYGIKTSGGTAVTAYTPTGDALLTKVDHVALREAVQDYLTDSNKRFLLPGQLADIPEIDAVTYRGVDVKAQSRNDLIRQVVGATTTQSNVFSIWVVAQSIKKKTGNLNPAIFEEGDTILGETRRRYIVERHLEYGKDGVPGNYGTTGATPATRGPGVDLIVGTLDDLISADYHPRMTYPLPYRWRIVSVENNPM
ncbi:MAG TPA: hypothetical protein VK970_17705 [Candidatus Methylacidiphilales bacterium]|nr:hypothetical protein [Candidatus Methylacidiphilales bacterium]